ncbi:MAG: DUF4912 domain-containing protein [Spirochaetaceae bacterium]|nr:DUF4912 domain-containing protein [Spirochaetaceae bacterium]
MTKDRLRSLSYNELSHIADQGNINVHQNMDKESLISVIFEALEEERLDREGNNNLTIQVEAKKYSVSQDQELFVDFGVDAELPDRYLETRLVLMLRDPSWVYSYWDIEDRILNELEENSDFSGFVLRVTELAAPDWGKDSFVDWFDIPIQFGDLRRYINLPSEDAFYGAEIYAQLGEKESLIVRSNIVESSRDYVAPTTGKENDNQDQLIALSGFSTDIGSFPGTGYSENENPQRIMAAAGGVETREV